jgi:hypothetical protein
VAHKLSRKITKIAEANRLTHGNDVLPRLNEERLGSVQAALDDPCGDRRSGERRKLMRQVSRRVSERVGDIAQADRRGVVLFDVIDHASNDWVLLQRIAIGLASRVVDAPYRLTVQHWTTPLRRCKLELLRIAVRFVAAGKQHCRRPANGLEKSALAPQA